MTFGEIDPRHHKFGQSIEFYKVFMKKKLEATLLIVEFSKIFDAIHVGKMEQILLAYDLPKETFAAIVIQYKKTRK